MESGAGHQTGAPDPVEEREREGGGLTGNKIGKRGTFSLLSPTTFIDGINRTHGTVAKHILKLEIILKNGFRPKVL